VLSTMPIMPCFPLDEGVYMDSSGGQVKDVRLQWGEIPSSIGQSPSDLDM
jgi:hypothetical protein